MGAALAIGSDEPLWGLALIVVSRLADGVDGALARLTRPTDRGAFLDITLDFLFYAGVPFFFAVGRPGAALPAAFVVTAAAVWLVRVPALALMWMKFVKH